MWKNYFKTALRNLTRNKVLAFINIFGLSLAFASSILLYLNARRELSYDTFFEDRERIYELYHYSNTTDGEKIAANMPFPAVPTVQKEVPGVEHATRFMMGGARVEYQNKTVGTQVNLVDPDFFKVFSFPILFGNTASPLASTSDVVLTRYAAKKIFNREDAVGQKLNVEVGGELKSMVVSAVCDDFPKTSSITFDALVRIENHPYFEQDKNNWDNWNHFGFVKLKAQAPAEHVEEALFALQEKYSPEDTMYQKSKGILPDNKGRYRRLRLMPLTEIHFNESSHIGSPVAKNTIYTILLISVVILLIACFNFVNLNVARAFTRVKEVGVRKSLGAQVKHVFGQLWGESFLISLLSVLIGLGIAALVLPHFNKIFRAELEMNHLWSFNSIVAMLAGLALVSLLAGAYPAFALARINTANILRGKVSVKRSGAFRNTLIVAQFTIAAVLMLCTAIAFKQFNYLQNYPLGFSKENVVSIPVPAGANGTVLMERLRNRLKSNPNILQVSASSINVGIGKDGGMSKWSNGFGYKDKNIFTNWMTVDYDFLKTMDIRIQKGRDFNRQFGDEHDKVIVTESMAAQFAEKEVIGLSFSRDSLSPAYTIVAVIPDIQLYSLHEKIEPMTLDLNFSAPNALSYVLVRTSGINPVLLMKDLEKAYRELVPGSEFQGTYLDENTQTLYRKEMRLSKLLGVFALVAIVLSCLGLFALAMLMIQQRVKEIGVRKVLGASVFQMQMLVSKQFLGLVFLAILIASPIAWYFMNNWLQRFPYKTSIDWWLFLVAAGLSLFIALITVSYHTLRAALTKPVNSLRTE